MLTNRKQSLKRGRKTRNPYLKRGILVSCYGFKIKDGILHIPLGNRRFFEIPMNKHTRQILSDHSLTVHSFTLTTNDTLSICYSKEIAEEIECTTIAGVDKNLRNLTVGDDDNIVQYELSKAVDIAENTRSIVRSFKHNDVRIRRKIAGKYGKRRKNRIAQLIHHVSKHVVQKAKQEKTAIAFERLTYIRRLYQKGNYQARNYRAKMNGWSFAEIKRHIATLPSMRKETPRGQAT